MEERRNGEAMEKRLLHLNEMIEVLAGAVLRLEKRCDDLELWTSGVDECMPDERLQALEAGIKRLSEWEAEAEQRLDWRRRPSAE